jgi:hypothetical protein
MTSRPDKPEISPDSNYSASRIISLRAAAAGIGTGAARIGNTKPVRGTAAKAILPFPTQ